ncbi:nucleoside 2-deoxyribosyltransferase [Dankookia rubra]|uniref:Nucleoside 2-deoxyribosyltransferase n=1 Tax=Dankookia rubra TaxID=1442381 RepID=A0A4R5QHG8_9PROT|nr:nucleoside 2-deoxyribosyltransferase [Dankookia rubra]TDH62782.1 nucleoside 2-deoxyribosyltransferase [Dankookia rubra]
MPPKAHPAGADVFLPDAAAHAARKVAICARHGIEGRPPLNEEVAGLAAMPEAEAWRVILAKDLAMMRDCDLIIAKLPPFRGASADAGTLVELGWFLGAGKPAFGCSNGAVPFAERSARQVAAVPDPTPGLSVGGFGLPDNLMIPGAVLWAGGVGMVVPEDGVERGFDGLEMVERCVRGGRRGWGR